MRCTTPQSWQGSPLRAPVASLRPWLFLGIEPIQSHQNVSPFHHSRETSLSLHPSILSGRSGAIAPLETHSSGLWPPTPANQGSVPAPTDTPMTISWRPTLRGLDADQVCRDPIPTTKSLPVLFGYMGQPCAGWICASISPLDYDQGNALGCGCSLWRNPRNTVGTLCIQRLHSSHERLRTAHQGRASAPREVP